MRNRGQKFIFHSIGMLGRGSCSLLLLKQLLATKLGLHWVGDLIAECSVKAEQPSGLFLIVMVQGGALFPHLTAAENASIVARHLRWDRERVAGRLADLAALARLSPEALARFPRALSGGQAQRVSLVRALFLDPEVLLLDEPLGALDPITRAELQEDLRAAFRAVAKTVVLVTHDLAEAAFLADRLVLLRDGRVIQSGTLADLTRAPAEPFVARFVGAHRALVLPEGP